MKRTFTSAGGGVGIGRGLVAGFGAVLAAIVWTPTWAALLGSFGFFESHPLTAARVILLPLALWGGYRFARRLPESFDHSFDAKRGLAVLWILLALVSLFQVARLSTYMVNPESDWYLSTPHPFWAKHECLTAYLYGAELNERGESNIYDSVHYPGLSQEARPASRLDGMVPEDPFQYPPQLVLHSGNDTHRKLGASRGDDPSLCGGSDSDAGALRLGAPRGTGTADGEGSQTG